MDDGCSASNRMILPGGGGGGSRGVPTLPPSKLSNFVPAGREVGW